MINNILAATAEVNPGIVVLIGISVVFLILLFLVAIVKLLKFSNKYLDNWDEFMLVVRGNRAEVLAVKKSYIDVRDEALNIVYIKGSSKELTAGEVKAQVAEIRAEFNTVTKPIMLQEVIDLKAKHKAVSAASSEECSCCKSSCNAVIDAKLIAVITAAIAVATEQECAERKVKFKVRTIKHLN